MKTKWKMLYLVLAIILFIIVVIPLMFSQQNQGMQISFYGLRSLTSIIMPIIILSMVEGALVILYLQSLLAETKKQDATKFDLSS